MLYDKLVKAWEEADVNLWDEIRHDEWEMLFHSDGRVVRKGTIRLKKLLKEWQL